MAAPAARAFGYWAYTSAKTWRISFAVNLVTPIMFLGALGVGLGSLVDKRHTLAGTSYLDFIAPALLALTVFQLAVNEAAYPVMASVRWRRTYEAMLATPLSVLDVMRGHLAFMIARTTVVGSLFLLACSLFGVVRSPWGLACIPIAAALAAGCGMSVAALSVVLTKDAWFAVIFRLVVAPLTLFSATFAPLSSLPGWVTPVAWATPLWHAVELCRGACAGTWPADGWWHVGYLVTLVGVGYALARVGYRKTLGA